MPVREPLILDHFATNLIHQSHDHASVNQFVHHSSSLVNDQEKFQSKGSFKICVLIEPPQESLVSYPFQSASQSIQKTIRQSTKPIDKQAANQSINQSNQFQIDASIDCFIHSNVLYDRQFINASLVLAEIHESLDRSTNQSVNQSSPRQIALRIIACDSVPLDTIWINPSIFYSLTSANSSISQSIGQLYSQCVSSQSIYSNTAADPSASQSISQSTSLPKLIRTTLSLTIDQSMNAPSVDQLTLTRICTPSSNGRSFYDQAIKHYFSQPRVLSDGQVLAICINPNDSQKYHLTNRSINHPTENVNKPTNSTSSSFTSQFAQNNNHPSRQSIHLNENFFDEGDFDSDDEFENDDPSANQSINQSMASKPAVIWYRVTARHLTANQSVNQSSSYFLVDPKSTSIVTEGSCHSTVPYLFVDYFTSYNQSVNQSVSRPINQLLDRSCLYLQLPTLNKYFDQLQSLIGPSLQLNNQPTISSNQSINQSIIPFSVLLLGPRHSMKYRLIESISHSVNVHYQLINMYDCVADGNVREFEKRVDQAMSQAIDQSPCVVQIRHVELIQSNSLISVMKNRLMEWRAAGCTIVATSSDSSTNSTNLSSDVRALFSHTVTIDTFDMEQRREIVRYTISQSINQPSNQSQSQSSKQPANQSIETFVDFLASKTAGLSLGELTGIAEEGVRQAKQRLLNHSINQSINQSINFTLIESDFASAFSLYTARMSSITGTLPSIPSVKWSDVGGLESIKESINELIDLPRRFPALFASGLQKRSGLLLFGPPGSGKTLLAKAVATQGNMNFLSVKGPELLNMYVGESERNVRDLFVRARAVAPCVLFFDEFDSLAPARGTSSDGGGVMSRVVSALCAELDRLGDTHISVLAATNRPDLLDPAMLRPGRLDRALYLGIATQPAAKVQILRALTRRFTLAADVDFDALVDMMSGNSYTGADCFGLSTDALLAALQRRINSIDEQVRERAELENQMYEETSVVLTPLAYLHTLTEDQLAVQVCQQDFITALNALMPSLSQQELDKYEQLRIQFDHTAMHARKAEEHNMRKTQSNQSINQSITQQTAQSSIETNHQSSSHKDTLDQPPSINGHKVVYDGEEERKSLPTDHVNDHDQSIHSSSEHIHTNGTFMSSVNSIDQHDQQHKHKHKHKTNKRK